MNTRKYFVKPSKNCSINREPMIDCSKSTTTPLQLTSRRCRLLKSPIKFAIAKERYFLFDCFF